MLENIRMLLKLDVSTISKGLPPDNGPGTAVQPCLAVILVGRPDSSTQELADKLRLIGRLKGFNEARLYSDVSQIINVHHSLLKPVIIL